jgi:uncharacterized integral membrane protein
MIRTACVLFFVAAVLNAVSVVLRYLGEGKIRWPGLILTLVCAALGVTFSRSLSGDKKRHRQP